MNDGLIYLALLYIHQNVPTADSAMVSVASNPVDTLQMIHQLHIGIAPPVQQCDC